MVPYFVLPLKLHVRFACSFAADVVPFIAVLSLSLFPRAIIMSNVRKNGGQPPVLSLCRLLCILVTWIHVAASLPQAGMSATAVFRILLPIVCQTDLKS